MAVASPLNLGRTSSFRTTRQGISNAGKSIQNISGILFRKTKVRRESIATSNLLTRKRIENENRAERETEAEAQKLVKSPIGRQSLANNTGGSLLDRIIGFIGYTALGWFMNNIPTWIGLGKEFIARLQKAGQIISSIASDTIRIVGGFGNVLSAIGKNIVSFDIFDNSKRLETALNDLNAAFFDMNQQFMDGFDLVGTPLTEAKYSGEEIPGLGTQQTDQGAYPETPTPPAPTGGTLSTEQLVSIAKQAGFNQQNAVIAAAVAKAESGGRSGVVNDNPGTGDLSYGLWQINMIGRLGPARLKQFGISSNEQLKDPLTNARAAFILSGGSNFNPWSVYRSGKYRSFLPEAQKAANVSPGTIQQVPVGNINPTVGDRLGAGRGHQGVDLQVKDGTPLRAVSDGVIVDSDFEKGWGNFLVMKDNLGIYHLYGHMQSGYKKGGPVKKGEVIGKVGMTGRTTGPHLHWETGTGWNRSRITGRFDALSRYSKFAPFNTQPGPGVASEIQTQISGLSQQREMLPFELTPDRKGSDIFVFAPDTQSQTQSPVSTRGGEAPVGPDEFTTLNNFIKKQLLLDLVYL